MTNRNLNCCFTGHRIIRLGDRETLSNNLSDTVKSLVEIGVYNFISGGALGFDTLAANTVISEREKNSDIRLILTLPCKEQTRGWRRKDAEEYERILSLADEVIYVSDEYYDGCMQKRNRYMVDNSSHCIFYMTSPRGGTAYTVKYAIENEITMHNIMIKTP